MASMAPTYPPRTAEPGYRAIQVLAYVRAFHAAHGRAPTYAMIRDHFGFQHNGYVHRIVVSLERRGMIARTGQGRVRRIHLLEAKC